MKKVFLWMAVAVGLAACSETRIENPMENDLQAIALKSSVLTMNAQTRAPYTGTPSAGNEYTAIVLATTAAGNYSSTLYANGTMTFKGSADGVGYNTPLEDGLQTFPAGDAPLYLSGLYPGVQGAGGWDLTTTPGMATYTLTGKDDVMKAAQVSTTKADVRSLQFANLDFTHELTKLEMCFRADGPTAIAAFGTIQKVELVGVGTDPVFSVAKLDLATGIMEFETSTGAQPCFGMSMAAGTPPVATYTGTPVSSNPFTLTTDNVYRAYTLAPPTTASATAGATEYEFVITYGGATPATANVKVDLRNTSDGPFTGPTAGYSFLISFHFYKDEINATATVREWLQGGESVVVVTP